MKKKNKETNKLLISIIAVALIIAIIGGATFAYWSWQSNTAQQTNVNVSVAGGNLTISGGNVTNTGMYPTSDCDGTGALVGGTATVTAVNQTESPMTVKLFIRGTLSAKQGSLTTTNKGKLNWAVVQVASSTATPSDNTCKTGAIASGTLTNVTTNTDINTGITFTAAASTTTTKYYKLYVWLDSTYSFTNSGSTVSDPMQNLTISVKWSPASIMTQETT